MNSGAFWVIVFLITMYIAIVVGAVFIVIAFYKAYARINSNNKSSIPILKSLLVASIMAILQLILLLGLKVKASEGSDILSLTVWFWLFAILAGFSLVAEIFLIKAERTANRWIS